MRGRKFWLALEALTGGLVLAFLGKLTGDFVTLASVVVGSFHAADSYMTGKSIDNK